MLRAFSLKSPLPWALLLGACLVASCDDRGATSVCPPLPLYQTYPLGDASPPDASSADGGEAQAALAAAVDAGCATAPTQFPDEGSAAGASGAASEGGGTSGTGGGSGAASAGSSSAHDGGSAGELAGAAGSG
ncbi:MAG: hypothetical protein ABUL62_18300 [Myxococcales bacterium]|jgi:hypothetical protein